MNFPLYLRRSTRQMAATIAVACSFLCAGSLRLQAQTSAPQVKIDTGTLQGAWGSGGSPCGGVSRHSLCCATGRQFALEAAATSTELDRNSRSDKAWPRMSTNSQPLATRDAGHSKDGDERSLPLPECVDTELAPHREVARHGLDTRWRKR